jgi:hypothetical protein
VIERTRNRTRTRGKRKGSCVTPYGERCWKAGHKHDVAHQHDDIDPLPFPGAPEPPFRDLPGRQVLDLPQRAWWEQAEQGHRAVQMVNRRASVIATTL